MIITKYYLFKAVCFYLQYNMYQWISICLAHNFLDLWIDLIQIILYLFAGKQEVQHVKLFGSNKVSVQSQAIGSEWKSKTLFWHLRNYLTTWNSCQIDDMVLIKCYKCWSRFWNKRLIMYHYKTVRTSDRDHVIVSDTVYSSLINCRIWKWSLDWKLCPDTWQIPQSLSNPWLLLI